MRRQRTIHNAAFNQSVRWIPAFALRNPDIFLYNGHAGSEPCVGTVQPPEWVPACAGKTVWERFWPLYRPETLSFPRRRESIPVLALCLFRDSSLPPTLRNPDIFLYNEHAGSEPCVGTVQPPEWVPACAGKTVWERFWPLHTPRILSFPRRRESIPVLALCLFRDSSLPPTLRNPDIFLYNEHAGSEPCVGTVQPPEWVPACAGKTVWERFWPLHTPRILSFPRRREPIPVLALCFFRDSSLPPAPGDPDSFFAKNNVITDL
ncbi:Uncharacterised protein [Legionella geestiana]|nr:Uncharacterised protein [Legionella geestiana]